MLIETRSSRDFGGRRIGLAKERKGKNSSRENLNAKASQSGRRKQIMRVSKKKNRNIIKCQDDLEKGNNILQAGKGMLKKVAISKVKISY